MSRKPRFKLQRRNSGDAEDRARHGNKRWINIYNRQGDEHKGFVLTFPEATMHYHWVSDAFPDETYRIVEKR